jgi:hypothetical protein
MLDEEEDARSEDFLRGRTDQPRKTEEECSGGGDEGRELRSLQCLKWKAMRIDQRSRYSREEPEGEGHKGERGTNDHGGLDQDARKKHDRHEDRVQPSNGAIKISHRRCEREALSVDVYNDQRRRTMRQELSLMLDDLVR